MACQLVQTTDRSVCMSARSLQEPQMRPAARISGYLHINFTDSFVNILMFVEGLSAGLSVVLCGCSMAATGAVAAKNSVVFLTTTLGI